MIPVLLRLRQEDDQVKAHMNYRMRLFFFPPHQKKSNKGKKERRKRKERGKGGTEGSGGEGGRRA